MWWVRRGVCEHPTEGPVLRNGREQAGREAAWVLQQKKLYLEFAPTLA